MSKDSKGSKNTKDLKKNKTIETSQVGQENNKDYLFSMSLAPRLNESTHWFQMIPVVFFTAFVIMITRMHAYQRPMEQFYWNGSNGNLTDFFSYYKMTAILVCAVFALVLILYRIFTQSFYIKRSFAYIPMLIYSVFVLLSYLLSEYKLFALWGWNDRFEGTVTILAYMVMLFFIINSVNSEKNVKMIIYSITASSTLLGILGLTQAFDHDFFRTTFGKKLITPSWFWDQIDTLNFTFQNKQIYQTVYNINYVSFYLTLLIPLFGMLFIRSWMKGEEEASWKKVLWGALFALLMFNLIGSVSSGGYLGMVIILILGLIVLNKRILAWRKPVIILLAVAILMCFANIDQLRSEFASATNFLGSSVDNQSNEQTNEKAHIDYIDTDSFDIKTSINGNAFTITTYFNDPNAIKVKDSDGKNVPLELLTNEEGNLHQFNDERFKMCTLRPAVDNENSHYILFYTDAYRWTFKLAQEGVFFVNDLGSLVDLDPVEQIGFESNPNFGSGRGFIWGTSIPMLKNTVLIGYGADTYCIYYPHDNYVGKYNAGWDNMNIVVDKPHNMYLGIGIGTGLVSLLALLILFGIYIVGSIKLYIKRDFMTDFLTFVGSGIFFGICGFLSAAIVNDSSVSVMPLFYGLLGTGIAINYRIKQEIF